LYNKIKLSFEKNKILNKEYEGKRISALVNECITIENNIKGIEKINENIKKCNNNSKNFKLKLSPEKEEELTEFLNNIKTFGKICNINDLIPYKWNKRQKKNNFTLSNNDKTMEIKYSDCYNAYFLDYIFEEKLEYSICISVNTFGEKLDYFYIGFMNEYEEISSNTNCLCEEPENAFYIRIDSDQIFQGLSQYQVHIENKTNLNLKFILNLMTKKLDIKNYDSNKSYRIIDVIGNKFRFFVGKCCQGTIKYTIIQ
jgi:hypothetical protein